MAFESVGEILDRVISDAPACGESVRLTPDARRNWADDDAAREANGRDKLGRWKTPPRGLADVELLAVHSFDGEGVWVLCPAKSQGYAFLEPGEFEKAAR